jgi:hypothetical protein
MLDTNYLHLATVSQQEDGLARVTREYACMGPSMVSRVCGMLGFGDKKSDEQKKRPLYGKTGAWPRLTLVQRVCSDGVGSDVAWTKMGGEVNYSSYICSEFAYLMRLKTRTIFLSPFFLSPPSFAGHTAPRNQSCEALYSCIRHCCYREGRRQGGPSRLLHSDIPGEPPHRPNSRVGAEGSPAQGPPG